MKVSHSMVRQEVRFLLDGKIMCVDSCPPTMTVLEYLREVAHRTGTKEGCAEGDCGACTVVLGEHAADGSRVNYRAVNSCIRFLPTIDGQELVTVESLLGPDGTLHPVQQAMVDNHGSQCGFCTPGFVMSLFALYLEEAAPSRGRVIEALSGNLCRCTGYRPMIEAGVRMGSYPVPPHWSSEATTMEAHRTLLEAIQRHEPLRLPGFYAPRTVDEVAAELEANPNSLVLAGGTDIGLWVTKQLRDLPPIVYIGNISALKTLRRDADGLRVGAAVSLADAWDSLVAAYPALAEMGQRFGSPPIRNTGTLCGNLANGSPVGDGIPVLIALGAEVELRCGLTTRHLPLEQLYLGYQRKDLALGEFIVSVRIPSPDSGLWVSGYKVSKRFDQDISAVAAAFAVRVEGGRVESVRLAFGGMAAVAARAPVTERALLGAVWKEASIDAAVDRLADDFKPLTDMRASSAYRLQAAGNLLRRFYFEHGDSDVPTRTADAVAVVKPT
ncbi:MAG: xanthine dehydrogenase small subunit [Steroidobacteraceae bacterium]